MFFGSLMVSSPSGGVKYQFRSREPKPAETSAGQAPPSSAAATVSDRYSSMSLARPTPGAQVLSRKVSSTGPPTPISQPARLRARPSRALRDAGRPRPAPTASCVTRWTSRSGPDSRAAVAPTPGPKTYCQLLRRETPRTIWVAFTPRAKSSSADGMSSPTTWWKVPPRSSTRVRWTASSFGEAEVRPSLRAT